MHIEVVEQKWRTSVERPAHLAHDRDVFLFCREVPETGEEIDEPLEGRIAKRKRAHIGAYHRDRAIVSVSCCKERVRKVAADGAVSGDFELLHVPAGAAREIEQRSVNRTELIPH